MATRVDRRAGRGRHDPLRVDDRRRQFWGGHGVSAFAGLNGGTANELGLNLNDVDFAMFVAIDPSTPGRSWTALTAEAGSIAFTGLPSVTATSSNFSVEVNRPADDGTLIDFLAQPLIVATGPSSSETLNMDGRLGSLSRAFGQLTLDVAGFFHVEGNLAFERSSRKVRLSDGSDVRQATHFTT